MTALKKNTNRFYERRWKCAKCGEPVIYDAEKKTLKCRCNEFEYELDSFQLEMYFKPIAEDLYEPLLSV